MVSSRNGLGYLSEFGEKAILYLEYEHEATLEFNTGNPVYPSTGDSSYSTCTHKTKYPTQDIAKTEKWHTVSLPEKWIAEPIYFANRKAVFFEKTVRKKSSSD